MSITAVLIDARTPQEIWDRLERELATAEFVGFDIETEDSGRHEGLNQFMRVNADGKSTNRKLVFDTNRTTVCGMSFYPDGGEFAYYINLAHADVENRVSFEPVRRLLDMLAEKGTPLLVHNGTFEIVMMRKSLGYELKNVICTLQMCVSAYGPDEYDPNTFKARGLEGMRALLPQVISAFSGWKGEELNEDQEEVLIKLIGKQSTASYSYNTYVNEISYGYGLKKAVQSWFGYKMATFEETLGDKAHMGQLTGEGVVSYGADDAYWCVRLFHRIYEHMLDTNPEVFQTFIEQENPMIYIYADVWANGMRVDREAILRRRDVEREILAEKLRELKAVLRSGPMFEDEPNFRLLELEKWYAKNHKRYRDAIEDWVFSDDSSDPYQQCIQVRSPLSNVWMKEVEGREPTGPNLSHYMVARTIYYDLLGLKPIVIEGKVQSDAECRGRLLKRAEKSGDERAKRVIELMGELASIDQRMKSYITPYMLLVDPDTDRLYPTLSSELATRRMAMSNPNTLALAKRGESAFVRGFFLPDDDDSLIVSIDWSSVELVLIGEESGDPEFARCFGQLPYEDLHASAAADAIGMPVDLFRSLARMEDDAEVDFPLVSPDGQKLTPKAFYKSMRTIAGKGANFNYWYSGALSSVGQTLGWSSEEMWEATERYRERFAVAEEWRVNTINEAKMDGYVTLRDKHRRVKFEATEAWRQAFLRKWEPYGEIAMNFAQLAAKRIQSRAYNQVVNAKIQGGCATMAKRSIRRLFEEELRTNPYWAGCRFMMPVHDELVFSVKKDRVVPFIRMAKRIMLDHPDIVGNLVLDATASVGRTFEPYHPEKAPYGQIEIDEAPKLKVLPPEVEGQRLEDPQIEKVVEYLAAA